MNENLPIQHVSFSSLRLFLSNQMQFKKEYILNVRDWISSPSAVAGSAYHKALETYYETKSHEKGMSAGLLYIETQKEDKIEWGKTGSRDKILKKFTQLYSAYLSEEPIFDEIISTERSITTEWEHEGMKGALPIKAKIDMIVKNKDKIILIDHKSVTTYTDIEKEKPDYIMQSMFYYFACKEEYGEIEKMIFIENKGAKNKDGSPQLNFIEINYNDCIRHKAMFVNLFGAVVSELSKPDRTYLPNFSDFFSGKESWEDYTKEIIDIKMPKPTKQTTARPSYKEAKYIESNIDKYDNRDLTPEERIKSKLLEFGIAVEAKEVYRGASISKYTFKPSRGVKMSAIGALRDDIALALGVKSVRIEAPIPGKKLIGVEVENEERKVLKFDDYYKEHKNSLFIPIGVDVFGKLRTEDLSKMPHLLISGTTGSGKSIMINSIITALINQNSTDELELVLIDPKRVELSTFKNSTHLKTPIIYEEQEALNALVWMCEIMEFRYKKLENGGYKNIDEFNKSEVAKMKRIVIIIDEFADLMTKNLKKETETAIIRLAQLARAAGIHMIIATQRPTVNVITGNIKANMPTRIAFFLPSHVDSKTILDVSGAEELLGQGDMLYASQNQKGLERLQGLFI